MAVQYKFRSSLDFCYVNLNGNPSISVYDLKEKIIRQKKLAISNNMCLVIEDIQSGIAFDNDGQIRAGSSVLVKRMPAWKADFEFGNDPSKDASNVERITSTEVNVHEILDGFGVDLYPFLENIYAPRLSYQSNLYISKSRNVRRCVNVQALSTGIGDNFSEEVNAIENQNRIKLERKEVLQKNLDKCNTIPRESISCFLCNAIFNEAVMIPCCQYSFCQPCIQSALIKTGRCPKCSSKECTVEALIPNVTLRQVVERFHVKQAANNASRNKALQNVTDMESGIYLEEEDGSGALTSSIMRRQGDQICLRCGSTDHLIRDCPTPSTSYQFNQTDVAFTGGIPMHGHAYWYGNAYTEAMANMNMYDNQWIMSCNPTMGPIHPYTSSMYYNGMPWPYGFMRVGGVQGPMMPREDINDRRIRTISHDLTNRLNEETEVNSPIIYERHQVNENYGFSHQQSAIIRQRYERGHPSEKSKFESDVNRHKRQRSP